MILGTNRKHCNGDNINPNILYNMGYFELRLDLTNCSFDVIRPTQHWRFHSKYFIEPLKVKKKIELKKHFLR